MSLRASLLFSLLLTGTLSAQDVAYEKYRLGNGMTVILHEDHRLPQVAVNVWYHVGSKDEEPGRSGFAHLFEHLMFMGTERVPGSDFDNIMEAGGGSNNATTSQDRTNYFESGPSELLPTLLWLEADRMEALGRTMTQEKLDKQRAVVRNERRQSYENRPYGLADLRSNELLYPAGHPYHISVIGTHADLEAAQVEDVSSFFATYYVPNNASLVIAGDFDPAEVKPLIEQLFGSLARGEDVVHYESAPVELARSIEHTMTDTVQFARTEMQWHSPSLYAPGDAEMDLLAAILGDGVSSRLYQELVVDQKLAIDVSAYQASGMLGSVFTVQATARPGVDLAELERVMEGVVQELRQNGIEGPELERQKASIEHDALDSLQSLLTKADRLNQYEFHFGEPNSFARDLDRYRSATPEALRDWAWNVLRPDRRLTLRVLPRALEPETNPRDARPQIAAAPAFAPPAPETFLLSNGVRVQHWESHELPLVKLTLVLPVGAWNDPRGKGGVAGLTADMLDEGAGDRSATEFADALQALGASLRAGAGQEWTQLSLSALRRNFEPSLALAADALLRPRFDESEWQRVQDLHIQGLRRAQDVPTAVASRVSLRAFFGDDHPYGRPVSGTLASAAAIELGDLRAFHRRAYRPAGAKLLIAGDLSREEAERFLERAFAAWTMPPNAGIPAVPMLPARAHSGVRVLLVDRPGAVQTVVRHLMPAHRYTDPDRPARELLAMILGGTFTSRLNQNLREEHGYTYGAGCGFQVGPSAGFFVAQSSVRADVTGASLREMLKEMRGLQGGDVSAEEARKARSTRRARMIGAFAGLDGILSAASNLVVQGLPFRTLGEELETVSRLTEADLNRLAASVLPLDQSLLVLVGDKERILEQLDGLGLPAPEEVSVEGDPVLGK